MKVMNLEPGDVFDIGEETAIFICREKVHPLYPNLCLTVWQMSDGSYSFDAVSPLQVMPGEYQGKDRDRLRRALGVQE